MAKCEDATASVDVTLLVCTYNRSQDLADLLWTAVAQYTDGTFTYEILVVDNNSSDDTRSVVQSFVESGHQNVRYVFEAKQGKSNALNTGLAEAAGSVYAITDDDFVLPSNWVMQIVNGFRRYPDASFVSGKVLPLWQTDVPDWAGPEHWSALALADYGDEVFYADQSKQLCLLACAFRRADVDAVGGYRPDLGVSGNDIGGVEDLDILQRLWKSGRRGVYLPSMWFHHKVQPTRLTRSYHRRWHTGHGRFYAALRDDTFERSAARLFDVPSHLYRAATIGAIGWVRATLLRKTPEAFAHEMKLRFFVGFFRERRAAFLRGGRSSLPELVRFTRQLIGWRMKREA
jgi:glycosyltransferase involved in cell wall biosynthesis